MLTEELLTHHVNFSAFITDLCREDISPRLRITAELMWAVATCCARNSALFLGVGKFSFETEK